MSGHPVFYLQDGPVSCSPYPHPVVLLYNNIHSMSIGIDVFLVGAGTKKAPATQPVWVAAGASTGIDGRGHGRHARDSCRPGPWPERGVCARSSILPRQCHVPGAGAAAGPPRGHPSSAAAGSRGKRVRGGERQRMTAIDGGIITWTSRPGSRHSHGRSAVNWQRTIGAGFPGAPTPPAPKTG